MITIKKLKSLKNGTRLRKYISILSDLENELKANKSINNIYYKDFLKLISKEEELPKELKDLCTLKSNLELRNINNIRHAIMSYLGVEPSEWDFTAPKDSLGGTRTTLNINLYLDDIRSPFNLGSIFRTSECFGVSEIVLSPNTTSPNHNRAQRTAMGCIDKVNWKVDSLENIKGPVFALELGGTPIDKFDFPENATVIIGSEELGVSPEGLKLADNSLGRVTIPLIGGKSSLNVSTATAILLQRWSEKLLDI